ncbi:MAG: pilus (MSHA type) biogenesis protein MshL [Methylotenera sp.]|uniref:pilus (MSHA type) biogenesis protein MshL n=1 Tax=Methylotenera sp. TaxID=2051956 RepID=UPI002728B054|nr:pilus (MSHA type) biogenesis protein MshL [Methylotenera sp.]MDO9152069.1 pilus (MSHA type) biogenesis protein MshL [Methylotenera sp.]
MNNKIVLALLSMILVLCMTACSHQSKVQPSKGHIDGQNTSTPSVISKPAASSAGIPKPVTNTPYLPPPTPKAKEPVYSIVVYDTPVKEVLFAIARDSKLNVDIHPAIQGRVTLNAVDQTLPAILERLSKQVDLTYHVKGNVLTITPDQPVLRSYKVDYVNINRDTKGFIGAAAEISSTGQAAITGAGGSTTTTSTSGNGANNSSRTAVTSESKNHLWESLIQNLKELLAETDKEVIVTRFGSLQDQYSKDKAVNEKLNNEAGKNDKELRDEQRSEYKTLFAANVIANPETGVISVRATNKQHEKIQEFLDKVLSSAKKQVLIEATIVEVRLNDGFQAGIDWRRLGRAGAGSGFTFSQNLNSDNFTTGGLTERAEGSGLVAGYFNPISPLGDIAASINLLKQFGDTKVLSSPKLMVLNNQTAVLKVVDNLVYFTVQAQQTPGTVSSQPFTTITTTPNTVPVGVVMSVTPQISDANFVNVNVRPTISRAVGRGVQDPNPSLKNEIPSFIPQIQVREMESILQINSGSTAILGGLMQDEIQRNSDKVPGLSDVPGVGKIFTGRDDANSKTELVIFLRPTVITNASLESDELASYKQYLPAQQLTNTLEAESER